MMERQSTPANARNVRLKVRLTILYATAIPATMAKADHRTELEIAAEGKQRLDEPQA